MYKTNNSKGRRAFYNTHRKKVYILKSTTKFSGFKLWTNLKVTDIQFDKFIFYYYTPTYFPLFGIRLSDIIYCLYLSVK